MLQSLFIRDLALLGAAEIRLGAGLNVLSGATGGGKSLVVTALKLLRGERASAELIRHGAEELRIDGEFALGTDGRWAAVAQELRETCAIEPEDGVLLVTRIVDRGGRSKVRIGGRPATLAQLRALCAHLLEIHGQGDTRALMRPEIQAETLDAFGGTGDLRERFAAALREARAARERMLRAAGDESARLERVGFAKFQLDEIDRVGLAVGEVEGLEQEHRVLAHLDRMREWLSEAGAALAEDEASAGDALGRAARVLREAVAIDAGLLEAAQQVEEAAVLCDDAARAVRSRLADLDLDPERLSVVEERLRVVRRALQRFGPTERELLERRAALVAELEGLDDGEDAVAAREHAWRQAVAALEDVGRKLVRARRKAAPRLVTAIEAELRSLAMPHAKFRVAMPEAMATGEALVDGASEHGPGELDFEVCINPGEPWMSMRKTASGGEAARIVLAVKKTLADQDRVPAVVFDEIDAEIGGRLGLQVGEKLAEVARHHQVLIVTHLPQVAAFADVHWKVEKAVRDGRTFATVRRLDRESADHELAAMAAGDDADATAIREARRLVARAKGSRSHPV